MLNPPAPNSQVEVGGMEKTPADQQPNETNPKLLTYFGKIQGQKTKILIDGRSMGDFISEKMVKNAAIPVRKVEGFSILFPNGEASQCNKETLETYLEIQDHREKVRLKVAPLPHHDIILGKPWLERWNLNINWRTNEIHIPSSKGTTVIFA